GELFLVNKMLYTLGVPLPFSSRRLEQARSFDGVTSASPVYVETRRARWRNPAHGLPWRIRVLAYPPGDQTLDIRPLRRLRDARDRPRPGKGGRALKAGEVRRPPPPGRLGAVRAPVRGRRHVRARGRLPERRHARHERGELPAALPRPPVRRGRRGPFDRR